MEALQAGGGGLTTEIHTIDCRKDRTARITVTPAWIGFAAAHWDNYYTQWEMEDQEFETANPEATSWSFYCGGNSTADGDITQVVFLYEQVPADPGGRRPLPLSDAAACGTPAGPAGADARRRSCWAGRRSA